MNVYLALLLSTLGIVVPRTSQMALDDVAKRINDADGLATKLLVAMSGAESWRSENGSSSCSTRGVCGLAT